MLNIQTLILARCGSKGIKNKNILLLNNYPLINYVIKAAMNSKVGDVWVSTNCAEISEVAKENGAKVVIRPDAISGDKSKSEEALLHFAHNTEFDILVFLQPTSPLLLPEDITGALKMMEKYDSVFSAYKEHWLPRWNLNQTTDQWDIYNRPMRQDMPEKYVENGALYVTTKKALLKSGCRYSGNIGIFEMPLYRSFQIDTYDDLKLIQKLL
jgi:N-acylneuraminate cytidylyltransferase